MKSWKTTLGGALSSMGKVLLGIGVVPQLSGEPNQMLSYIAIAGFLLDAMGGFFAHLFSADQASVVNMIEKSGGDTRWVQKEKSPFDEP
jgi:hypothetical protein